MQPEDQETNSLVVDQPLVHIDSWHPSCGLHRFASVGTCVKMPVQWDNAALLFTAWRDFTKNELLGRKLEREMREHKLTVDNMKKEAVRKHEQIRNLVAAKMLKKIRRKFKVMPSQNGSSAGGKRCWRGSRRRKTISAAGFLMSSLFSCQEASKAEKQQTQVQELTRKLRQMDKGTNEFVNRTKAEIRQQFQEDPQHPLVMGLDCRPFFTFSMKNRLVRAKS
eukprot:s702_g25.t1